MGERQPQMAKSQGGSLLQPEERKPKIRVVQRCNNTGHFDLTRTQFGGAPESAGEWICEI